MLFNESVNEKLIEFCEDRKKGAKKIASESLSKGGIAKLTYWHFHAKLEIYDECIKMIKQNKKVTEFQKKFNSLKEKINFADQRHFQEVVGQMEVWGEVIVKMKGN